MAVPNREVVSLPSHRSRTRDLGDDRLWQVSHARSLERRARAASRGRPVGDARTATATLAVVATAGAAIAPAVSLAAPVASSSVTATQRALGVDADGVVGPQTRAAIRAFQRAHGLRADGIVGPQTRAALGLAAAAAPRSSAQVADASTSTSSSAVRKAQAALGVAVDGILGPQTRGALERFQSAHGLPATGALDSATTSALAAAGPAPATRTTAVSDETGAATPTDPAGTTPSGTTPPGTAPATTPAAPGAGAQAAVAAARSQIGKPYARAGSGPSGFDCSGLTVYAFGQAGVSLPRTSYAQYGVGSAVSKSQIQPGDLVFFNTAGSGASHVGVATGPTTFISATTHGVMEADFSSGYWASHYVGARRVA